MDKEKNFISAIVYVYNNEEIILKFLEILNSVLYDNFESYEIICVNDCSVDESVDEIKKFCTNFNCCVSIVNMSFYHGLESAMNAGLDLSIGDFVYEFDNCFIDYDISTIMEAYNRSLDGFDIVNISPKNNLKLSSKLFYKIFNRYSHSQYKLCTESFRILSRRAINRIYSMSKTIPYRKAIYANCGLKLHTIFYNSIKSLGNKRVKQITDNKKAVAINSLVLFTDIAYKCAIGMTFLMMFITVATGIYTVVIYLKHIPIEGWTTIMLFLSISFLGVFAILAIIIKYLSILIDLVFKKQQYNIESIEKL